jgi:hypothetical protein
MSAVDYDPYNTDFDTPKQSLQRLADHAKNLSILAANDMAKLHADLIEAERRSALHRARESEFREAAEKL